MSKLDFIMTPEFRKWAYALCMAVSSLLGILGVYNGEILGAINAVLAAFFGIAFLNTPHSPNMEVKDDYEPKH